MCEWLILCEDKRLERLEKLGIRLDKLEKLIPWETFRPELQKVRKNSDPKLGGRPAYDVVMMFKVMILQALHNLTDPEMEYMIADRLSYQKFLGISPDGKVPDQNTIANFREDLKKKELYMPLFERFNKYLDESGFEAKGGQIVDATFAEVPKRHDTKEDDEHIQTTGQAPENWTNKQKSHKDVDARWTMKRKKSFFGYKHHICVDAGHKIIRKFDVTPANVHDSQRYETLLTPQEDSNKVYADSGYVGEEHEKNLRKMGYEPQICERPYKGHPLTEEQKASNRIISHTRVRVEHIFACISQYCRGNRIIRTIGLKRALVKLTLQSLAYNMCRYCVLI